MQHLVVIAAGGALGAVLRYATVVGMHGWLGRGFPYGTVTANVVGCLLMGVLYVLLPERVAGSAEWRPFLLVGLLGGYTTFSAFSLDTLLLIEEGDLTKAAINVLASVVVCLAATFAGMRLARLWL